MVGEQPRRVGPVPRGLGMPDGVDDLTVAGEPSGGQPVQGRQLLRQPSAQLKPEQVSEEVVIPEPGPGRIERYDKRVGVFEVQQDPSGPRVTGQQVRQFAVDAVEQGRTQKQLLDLGRLALQHLGEQVLGNRPAAAGEFCDKSLRVRAAGK